MPVSEREEVTKIERAAGEGSGNPTRDDRLAVRLGEVGDRDLVVIFSYRFLDPLADRREAAPLPNPRP